MKQFCMGGIVLASITAGSLWASTSHTRIAVAVAEPVTASVAAPPVAPPRIPPPQAGFQAPGFYRFKLGDFEITALSDGTVQQAMDELLHAPAELVRTLYNAHYQTLPAEISMNAFLLHTGDQLLLIDTGAGHSFGPTIGNQLLAHLRLAGYEAQDIDAVLLTHIHGDHSGGLIDQQAQAVFPNATVYVHHHELQHWFSDTAKAQAPHHHHSMFDAGRKALAPYIERNRVHTFHANETLFPGVVALAAPGHTPGHSFFRLDSQGQRMVVWGDVVHAAEVQLAHPHISIAYDTDPHAAAQQRLTAYADAAKHAYWVAAPHIAFPGIGHIRRNKGDYEWIPAPYSTAQ